MAEAYRVMGPLGISKVVWFAAIVGGGLVYRGEYRRAAFVALAMTGPLLWAPMLLEMFRAQILQADAILVSDLIGTDRVGNVFSAVTGSDRFAIWDGCSSLHGISKAILAWVAISNWVECAWSLKYLFCGFLVAFCAIAINVARLSLIGLFPSYYPMIHGSAGALVVNWLFVMVVVAISLFGNKQGESNDSFSGIQRRIRSSA